MAPSTPLRDTAPAFAGVIGVGRRDITPPVGIYARMWGAAKHDRSEGTHRPMTTTALALRQDNDAPPIVLVSVDLAILGDLGAAGDERYVREGVLEACGLDEARLMIACTHTHSSPWAATSRASMPGGELLKPYLDHLRRAITEAAREALLTAVPATLTWATGRCALATNRDLPDPDESKQRLVCGFNPDGAADDAVLVGRVTCDADSLVLATLVNYACHPTTLAWDNRLVSPDFIGAMRETVEAHTTSAPCLFLQGASGELAPAHQYAGETAVADGHGRQLGFAALAALQSMLPPRHELVYDRVVESGAPLAVWKPQPFTPDDFLAAEMIGIDYPLKPMPTVEELDRQLADCTDRMMAERLFRKKTIVETLGGGATHAMPAWVWRAGRTVFVGHPNEAYSHLQLQLRAAFPDCAVVVMNVVNGEIGYLPPDELYDEDLYQVWQTPFDRGSLDLLIERCRVAATTLLGDR